MLRNIFLIFIFTNVYFKNVKEWNQLIFFFISDSVMLLKILMNEKMSELRAIEKCTQLASLHRIGRSISGVLAFKALWKDILVLAPR